MSGTELFNRAILEWVVYYIHPWIDYSLHWQQSWMQHFQKYFTISFYPKKLFICFLCFVPYESIRTLRDKACDWTEIFSRTFHRNHYLINGYNQTVIHPLYTNSNPKVMRRVMWQLPFSVKAETWIIMLLQRSTWTLFSFNVRLNIIQEKKIINLVFHGFDSFLLFGWVW